MVTVGLVAEGPHDFIMLTPLIQAELHQRGYTDVVFKELQPFTDATTGIRSEGGYSRVIGWCKSYSGEKIDTFFTPLFDADPGCDLIVIHMDGDAVVDVSAHTSVPVPLAPINVLASVQFVTAALEEWLSTDQSRRDKIALAIPVQHTEAWILAVEKSHPDPASIHAKTEFRKGRKKLKMTDYYRIKVASAVKEGWEKPVCASYQAFEAEFDQVIKSLV